MIAVGQSVSSRWQAACMLGLILLAMGGCSWFPLDPAIVIQVVPTKVQDAAADEICLLLVTVPASPRSLSSTAPISLSVEIPGAVATIYPEAIHPGEVAEVSIVPDIDSIGKTLIAAVCAGNDARRASATLHVTDAPQNPEALARDAAKVRDAFIPWLQQAHPELAIGPTTDWTPIPIRTHRLVVTHYLFLSDRWEMVVWWHVTIPPHDWARMTLRRRFVEATPSHAAEITSLAAGDDPVAIHAPNDLIR